MKNLLIPGIKVKASSGTSKDAKSILDDSLETYWSGQANDDSKATLTFTFPQDDNAPTTSLLKVESLKRLDLTFQGGYSVKKVTLLVRLDEGNEWERVGDVFPRDGNERQQFDVPALPSTISPSSKVSALRLELESSTDDFGRIILYRVALWSRE